MKTYSNEYAQKIYNILAPMIGELMANATIKSKATQIGKTEDSLTAKDLAIIAPEIKKGLVVFLGNDAAEKISAKINQIA
jgi:hypothetical protein